MKKKENEQNTKHKIGFFRKIYYSIFKISKYDDLANESVFSAIKYMSKLLLIIAIVFAAYTASMMLNSLNKLKTYLNDNLPEMKYEEGILTVEKDERTVLDDEIAIANFRGQIIIDTVTEYETLIAECRTYNIPTIILTSNYYTTIDKNGNVSEYKYNIILEQLLGNNIKKIDKTELLYLFDNVRVDMYFITYLIADFILFISLVIVYSLIVSLVFFIISKVKKMNLKYSKIFKMNMYALTITVFGYIILNFIPKAIYVHSQAIITIIPIVYLIIYFNKKIYENET